ncbi:hypothetical protein HGA34_01985 [Candidatus Falkowbacteria bacterium]|nr:hypothetical protein [Candidatus Falkowbacteria bacterium]
MLELNQQQAALDLRLAQAAERNSVEPEESVVERPEMSLRQRRLLAKKQEDQISKVAANKLSSGGGETASQGVKFATARLLRAAWMSEGTIVGFLLGLVYINIHVFLRMVLGPNMFCKLGEEWSLGKTGTAGKTASTGLFLVEAMQLILFDLLILAILAFVCFWLYLLAQLITSPWETIQQNGWEFFKSLWDLMR